MEPFNHLQMFHHPSGRSTQKTVSSQYSCIHNRGRAGKSNKLITNSAAPGFPLTGWAIVLTGVAFLCQQSLQMPDTQGIRQRKSSKIN
jgi:hypothetical protein